MAQATLRSVEGVKNITNYIIACERLYKDNVASIIESKIQK
jgi:hypothetical protein